MTDEELREALVWLYASDCGLVRPGDHDTELRRHSRQEIWDRLVGDEVQLRVWISRMVRDVFLSETALANGHGIDDACEFWSWFDHAMWSHGCEQRHRPAAAAHASTG